MRGLEMAILRPSGESGGGNWKYGDEALAAWANTWRYERFLGGSGRIHFEMKGGIPVKSNNDRDGTKELYVPPRILASYDREALEESLHPHGQQAPGECSGGLCGDGDGGSSGCGSIGCGCGCS